MIRCEHCGAPLPDGAIFCGECGRAVSATTPRRDTAPPAGTAPEPPPLQQPGVAPVRRDPAADAWLPEATLDPATRAWLTNDDRAAAAPVPVETPDPFAPRTAPTHVHGAGTGLGDWAGNVPSELSLDPADFAADPTGPGVEASGSAPTGTADGRTEVGRTDAVRADDGRTDDGRTEEFDPEVTRPAWNGQSTTAAQESPAVPTWSVAPPPPAPAPAPAPQAPSWWIDRTATQQQSGQATSGREDSAADVDSRASDAASRDGASGSTASGTGASGTAASVEAAPEGAATAGWEGLAPSAHQVDVSPSAAPAPRADAAPAGDAAPGADGASASAAGRVAPEESRTTDDAAPSPSDPGIAPPTTDAPRPGDTAIVQPLVDRAPVHRPAPLIEPGSGPATCHVCGHTLEPDDIFCESCGAVRPAVTAAFTGPIVPLTIDRPDWSMTDADELPGEAAASRESASPVAADEAASPAVGNEAVSPAPDDENASGADVGTENNPAPLVEPVQSDLHDDTTAPPSTGFVPEAFVPGPSVPTAAPLPPIPQGPGGADHGSDEHRIASETGFDDEEDVEATRIVGTQATRRPVVLHVSTGERLTVQGSGLLGRFPRPDQNESFDALLTIVDPGKSVSKTHLELGRDGDDLWVSDRFSGNGTVIRHIDGSIRRCEPGRRYRVERGARVDIGEQFFLVQ